VVLKGRPSELKDEQFSELCTAIVINDHPDERSPIGMEDDDFIRGPAPMTKSEVRSLSIVKMKLEKDSIIYDVGAGTGSVSIEMARVAHEGMVYAIEKETSAVELIECNKKKFATPNVTTVTGMAPFAFEGLPAPTHAFIGGSSGNLESIVESLLGLNPDVRIVMNAVTLETVGEIMEVIHKFGFSQTEIVHLSVSKARELGKYHLMTAQNPIYIVTVQK
jgi:precorrin-6Y C5,15-methyltransferase (decarboxylating)